MFLCKSTVHTSPDIKLHLHYLVWVKILGLKGTAFKWHFSVPNGPQRMRTTPHTHKIKQYLSGLNVCLRLPHVKEFKFHLFFTVVLCSLMPSKSFLFTS